MGADLGGCETRRLMGRRIAGGLNQITAPEAASPAMRAGRLPGSRRSYLREYHAAPRAFDGTRLCEPAVRAAFESRYGFSIHCLMPAS